MTEGQVTLSVIQPLQLFTIRYSRLYDVCKSICDVKIKWRQCIKVNGSEMISLCSVKS